MISLHPYYYTIALDLTIFYRVKLFLELEHFLFLRKQQNFKFKVMYVLSIKDLIKHR